MESIDLNLLVVLDALLAEESVSGAARRLKWSEPSTSRALSRLRVAIGDPLLVRAGRRLVPTPKALALRTRVKALVEDAQNLFQHENQVSMARLERTFTIRSGDAFVGAHASALIERVRVEAPGVTLRFAPEGDEDVESLRSGLIDLDIGVLGPLGPELKSQRLFEERFVGVVGPEHPLAKGAVTAKRFVEYPHVSSSRRGRAHGPIDLALQSLGLSRRVILVVPSFYAALFAVAQSSSLIAAVPSQMAEQGVRTLGLRTFELPVATEPVEVVQTWHPRFDADPAHQWLRSVVRAVGHKLSRKR